MKIKIYINKEPIVVELYEVTYEYKPDQFKSLRLSNGTYPDFVDLDYKDNVPKILPDFFVSGNDISELFDMFSKVKTKEDSSTKGVVIDENWMCFQKGTPVIYIQMFLKNL